MFKNLSISKVYKMLIVTDKSRNDCWKGTKRNKNLKRMYSLNNLETPTDKTFTTQTLRSNHTI